MRREPILAPAQTSPGSPGQDFWPARGGLMGNMRTHRYQIIVSGRLGAAGHVAFEDLHIEPHGPDTALTGDLNRSGLHDVLTRIRDLAFELVGLTCLAPEPGIREVVRT